MKNKRKRKFQDFHEYTKNQNNNTFSKNDIENDKETKNKKKYEFKSSLDKLIFLFPNFSSDLIKDVFEENDNNFSKTKEFLKKLSEDESNNKIEENQNIIKENQNNNNIIEKDKSLENNKDNYKKNNKDITHLAQFEIVYNNENIEETNKKKDEDEKIIAIDNQKNNDNFDNKNNDYNIPPYKKDKNKNEYYSIFNEETNDNNNNCINNYSTKDDIIIDDYLFEQNKDFLCECFQEYTREKIVSYICDLNFDIDAVVLTILNEKI